MLPAALFLLVIADPRPPTLHDYMPCTPGLRIEYVVEPKDRDKAKQMRMIETVRGPGKEPDTCVIDRVTFDAAGKEQKDAWARELLPDRITNAGWVDRPVAFRTPLLRTPVEAGRKWRFNTTDFEIKEVGDTFDVPAGTFEGCARVVELAANGEHAAHSVYAPGVGLILYESKQMRTKAVVVSMPKPATEAENAPKVRPQQKKSAKEESPKTSR